MKQEDLLIDNWMMSPLTGRQVYIPKLTELGKKLLDGAKTRVPPPANTYYTIHNGFKIEFQELEVDHTVPKQITVQIFKITHKKNGAKVLKFK